jgi:hypothetical protein
LSAPPNVSLFPPNNPDAGAELPKGVPEAAPPKGDEPGAEAVVAGFAPKMDGAPPVWGPCPPNNVWPACAPAPACVFCVKIDEPACAFPPACVFWPPNKLGPGGAPAGVVDERKLVLVAAGVAAGVDAARLC